MSCHVAPSAAKSAVMFLYVRRICARKSPMCTDRPCSSILAVPEMSRVTMLPMSMRIPRENELGLAYSYASLSTPRLVMARFSIGSLPTFASSAIRSPTAMLPPGKNELLLLPCPVTQSLGRRHPDVIALEVNAEDVVVCRCRLHRNVRYVAIRVAHVHLGRAGLEVRAIHCPVRAVVICQPLIGAEPRAIGIQRFHLVGEVAGQAAVFGQEVVPVPAIVPAVAKIRGDPQNLVYVTHR